MNELRQKLRSARGDLVHTGLGILIGVMACAQALAATGPFDGTDSGPPIAGRPITPTEPDRPASRALTGNPLWALPLSLLSSTRERPLFSPSRRPPAVAVVSAPPPPPPPPAPPAVPEHPPLTLVGTIIGKTESIGIFIDQATKDVVRLRTGEAHANWTLRAIEGREAVLESNQQEATLALPPRNGLDQAAPSAPATTAAKAPPQTRMGDAGQKMIPAMPGAATTSTIPAGKPNDSGPSMRVDRQATTPPAATAVADASPDAALPTTSPTQLPTTSPTTVDTTTWVDGDGRPIGPPPAQWPALTKNEKPDGEPPPPWFDGDNQPISPPPARSLAEGDAPPGAAPTTWVDGDGQSISPPPNTAPHKPVAWVDGDGQIVSSR